MAEQNLPAVGSRSKRAHYEFVYRDSSGVEQWRADADNLVPSASLDAGLDSIYGGSGFTAYLALVSGTPTFAAGDTLASHAGWTEQTPYSGNRPAVTWSAASGGVKSNSSNPVVISITASATIGGVAIVSAATGTTGLLDSEAAFNQGNQAVSNGGTLTITVSVTATSA